MNGVSLASALHREASATDERRAIVLSGERERGYEVLESILAALEVGISETTLVGPDDRLRCEHRPQVGADELLGTTHEVIVLDAHADLQPNALGRIVGAVNGGGLLILLTPTLEEWPNRRGRFARSLAVPPYSLEDVTGHFIKRLAETIRAHPGIAVLNLDSETVEDDGLLEPAPKRSTKSGPIEHPPDQRFPTAAYEACLTGDQVDAVAALESLFETERAVVLEANRGRGKSSAAGIAAGCFALDGTDVLVTAPDARNTTELFDRARELVALVDGPQDDWQGRSNDGCVDGSRKERHHPEIRTNAGGCIRFLEPDAAIETISGRNKGVDRRTDFHPEITIVDEAAALPVSVLERFLEADRVAFTTTIHGYEGAGRGFSVRFRDRLEESRHEVTDRSMADPIRYAAGDPIEVWSFRALGLDARPPVDQLVTNAAPETVEYRRLEPADLLADESLLREAFGLLVLAHYRTEPNDLARLLDAPNLEARALVYEGHIVSIALLAREGNLSSETRSKMYEGSRVRGNMLPDILTSQLRDESAGEPAGVRVVRIATHHAVRSRGLGSKLLECIRDEFEPDIDWIGTAFGATPGLLEFWAKNGFNAVHVSTTRNDASGEHSVLMTSPASDSGQALAERHAGWFARRFPALCSDSLTAVDSDVIRGVLRTVDASPELQLSDHEWRVVAGAAYGPGRFDVDPGPFRELVLRSLLSDSRTDDLSASDERLLVARVLQGLAWESVADRLGYHSASQCRRALGNALVSLVEAYGTDAAFDVRDRFA
ncbi:tRNA(Met) cytidine acetyltransferase TmcA [Halostagnicola sp. A-GB9-2]|uniref:tRNA(Met) cytidine acetyltransferase TmcA n=1 Tax=Halostagnicola sp. A-GB9-2 TaxID=3048066 RepID=UPI0024BFA264|nr:tRNA(Met) cytidine acetyltransferase TmcA [Halostagnicola sp. A-GB9-2]MDJ1431824.1 tRNA(Met) cytidine acetyltransferase TmcA [Halostagnicola sp. A-GB9-2]